MQDVLRAFATLAAICAVLAVAPLSPVQAQASKLAPLERLAPPFTADKVVILAKLRQKDFSGLELAFERYQEAFEKSPAAELEEQLAFDSFATDDTSVGDLIAKWIRAKPHSFAAHVSMSSHLSWRGWHTRGPAVASMTRPERFEEMQKYFAESADEAKRALKIRPKLSMAYVVLLGESRGEANWTLQRELEVDALRRIPANFCVREQVMECLYPRWGGNHAMMADFAQQSQVFVKANPYMHWLLGFIDLDEGETLGIHGEFEKSIVALTRALQEGGDYSGFYFSRGIGYLNTRSFEQALEDFDRANELSPQDPELLIRRATALAALRRPQEALADLKLVGIFEAQDDLSKQIHDWAVAAIKEQH